MSNFTIYPAIDMRGGKCVRLIQEITIRKPFMAIPLRYG